MIAMLFVKLSRRQAAAYAYTCERLQKTLNKITSARKTLEDVAASSLDKSFAKCVYLFASESKQFENEIHAQLHSFNCRDVNRNAEEIKNNHDVPFSATGMGFICNYLEENYIQSYRQLLKDKYLSSSLKSLIKNQLQSFLSSLAQLRLFNEVKTSIN
jgi:hypothetical protein